LPPAQALGLPVAGWAKNLGASPLLASRLLLPAGCWLLAAGCWQLLAAGRWPLAAGRWPLAGAAARSTCLQVLPSYFNLYLTFNL
jgi:hypothetical protein